MNTLPRYNKPPLGELVISAQFDPVESYTSSHAGWFWKNYLDDNWTHMTVHKRIEDRFENFEDNYSVQKQAIIEEIVPGDQRVMFHNKDDERLIQIQDTRFLYNWRKRENDYPSYSAIVPEFFRYLELFKTFVNDLGEKPLFFNQWEISYHNYIEKGDMWETANDWHLIFPFLVPPAADIPGQSLQSLAGNWIINIGESKGRLHISNRMGRIGSTKGPVILNVNLLARGPVTEQVSLENGLSIGHESIVRSFTSISSEQAHQRWERTQ